MEAAVDGCLTRAGLTGGVAGAGAAGVAADLSATVRTNHEQLVQLLSALRECENQIFQYQQLAHNDLMAIRDQLRALNGEPAAMYDHRNMKI